MALPPLNRIKVVVSGARGPTGLDIAGDPQPGQYLVWNGDRQVQGSAGTGNDPALRTDLAASGGSALVGYRSGGTGAVTRSAYSRLMDAPLNVKSFGCKVDGTTDDGANFTKALTAAAALNLPLQVPQGVMLIKDTSVASGGVGFILADNVVIQGEGEGSIIRFQNDQFASFYGFNVTGDNVCIKDLAIEVNKNGNAWCAAVGVTDDIKNLKLTDVTIRGVGSKDGAYGVFPMNSDIFGLTMTRCHFQGLAFGYLKETGDVSTQVHITATDCSADDCTEVLEFNSPGLWRGVTTVGSAIVTQVSNDDGSAYDTSRLSVGMTVRSTAFPVGTVVQSINSATQVTLSQNAILAFGAGDKARLSSGGCGQIVISNFHATNIDQWAVGFANVQDAVVDLYCADCRYEAVHIEDASSRIKVSLRGVRLNMSPGVVGSPSASNGAVQILPGCSNIAVHFDALDIRSNTGSPTALTVQPAGLTGTVPLAPASSGVTVGGEIVAVGGGGCKAVIAYNTHIHFDGLFVNAPSPNSARPETIMYGPGCSWSGRLRVRNPGGLFECDSNAVMLGMLDDLVLEEGNPAPATGQTQALNFARGFFAADRNAPPIAKRITFRGRMTANVAADWVILSPAPSRFYGVVGRAVHGTSGNHSIESGPFEIKAGALVDTPMEQTAGGTLALSPSQAGRSVGGWRINAGKLEMHASTNNPETCEYTVTFDGFFLARGT